MSSAPVVPPPVEQPAKRRVVFVVGPGGSGTSTMTGALRTLGMKGSEESQWVVDLHTELLERCNVEMSDARPSAWFETGRLSTFDPLRVRLHTWLESQLAAHGPELVITDPSLPWYLGLWRSAALRCGATPAYVTMLRPVTEVVADPAAGEAPSEAGRTAAWVNMMLHTERSTRGAARAFVRHGDMLSDWTVPLFSIGQQFDLDAVKSATANDIRRVHQLIDPGLHRVSLSWDGLDVPKRLRDLAEETWESLARLADPDGDQPEVHARLDALRSSYAELYAESEAIAQSTARAAGRTGAGPDSVTGSTRPGARLVDRVPHGVRAMIPPSARRGLRRTFGRGR